MQRLALAALWTVAGWAALAAPAAAQGLGEALTADGERLPGASIVLLPAAKGEAAARAAVLGSDLVAEVQAGRTLVAVGETVGRIGGVTLQLDPDAIVVEAPDGVGDLQQVPAGEWLAVAAAPGYVPAAVQRYVVTTGQRPDLQCRCVKADTVLVRFELRLRWDPSVQRPARVTLRAISMEPEAARRLLYRDGKRRLDLRYPARTTPKEQRAEVQESAGVVRAVHSEIDTTLTLPLKRGAPIALVVSPATELRVWGGEKARAGRLGVVKLGDAAERSILMRAHTAGRTRVTIRVTDRKGEPVPAATVYLFPEGGRGFGRRGAGAALQSPQTTLKAIRAMRGRPLENDLGIAGARKRVNRGAATFEGLPSGAARCVVVADGYIQRNTPEIEIPHDGEPQTITVKLRPLQRYIGVAKVMVIDPLGGPFLGRVRWSITGPGFADSGGTLCREDGLTLVGLPGEKIRVTVSTGERGGLSGSSKPFSLTLGTTARTKVLLMPPDEKR
jgi:hypothetical protein